MKPHDGINFRGFGATKFSEAVQGFMRDNHMSRETTQDNGTEQPTGPPSQNRTFQEEIEAQMRGEPAGQKENTAESGGERYLIETLQDGRKYVRADRQVIFGNDPDSWSEQVEDYINGKIRRGQDVSLMAENGGVFTITSETAGKMADNHTSDGRTLDDEKFYVKANAAVHIDELVQISKPANNKVVPDRGGRHGDFAAGGWRYRVAYFHDFDGKHYRIQFSVADGNKGNVPYNIGDIEERSFPKITGPSANGGALNGETSSKHSIRNQLENVKQQIQAVLDKVSPNHAEQMQRYTELKNSDSEAAQRIHDELMDGPYATEFEEYLSLTELLAKLKANGYYQPVGGSVERMYEIAENMGDDLKAVDTSKSGWAQDLPARYSLDDTEADVDEAKDRLIEELRKMSPQDMMGDDVRRLIDQYTTRKPSKPQKPKFDVDRGNLRRALSSTLGLTEEQKAKLGSVQLSPAALIRSALIRSIPLRQIPYQQKMPPHLGNVT